jgi:hypothetical protein
MVQTAANAGHFKAVVKLVEAGASWRLAKGQQRVMGGSVFYVPEILRLKNRDGSGMKVRSASHNCCAVLGDMRQMAFTELLVLSFVLGLLHIQQFLIEEVLHLSSVACRKLSQQCCLQEAVAAMLLVGSYCLFDQECAEFIGCDFSSCAYWLLSAVLSANE